MSYEEEHWVDQLAWDLAQQEEVMTNEKWSGLLNILGLVSNMAELMAVKERYKEYKAFLGRTATTEIQGQQTSLEDFEGWHGLD